MRILVTGGAGFIGSNFVRYVSAESSANITVVDALTYAASPESLVGLHRSVNFVEGNILDKLLMEELVADADVVVNFAAETHNDNSLDNPEIFIQSNVGGTLVLLEVIRKTGRRLHHISTDEVFGDLPLDSNQKFSEESNYRPSSPYSASKAASDHLVRAWVRSFGLRATISNCSNNFGPWQHVEKFIPRQITAILSDELPKIYGSGAQIRDWIHVDDHSSALVAILERGRIGETYLIGTNGERSNLEVVQSILRVLGKPSDHFEFVKDRPGHDQRYAIDARKLKNEIGWLPKKKSFEAAITETITWYSENRPWWEDRRKRSEKLYSAWESRW